jgi:hypothetical protein
MSGKITHTSRDVLVYDDVLAPRELATLFAHLNTLEYHSVHARSWRKVWRLYDGNPLTSKVSWLYPEPPASPPDEPRYPTGTPMDALIEWIASKVPEIEAMIGHGGSDWEKLSVAPWIYPPGSALSMHRDGGPYSGAFTFFAHPEWRIHWGGHLLVLNPSASPARPAPPAGLQRPFLTDDHEADDALDPGLALTVFAKPNRIAFLSPTVRHLLTRVDGNAGQHARISVAGFFHKPTPGARRALACQLQ